MAPASRASSLKPRSSSFVIWVPAFAGMSGIGNPCGAFSPTPAFRACVRKDIDMTPHDTLGGAFTPAGTELTLKRMGYGAMQLAGPHVFGPPKDPEAAVAVLRAAVEAGVNHIDTADFYGPHVTNEIIRKALHPYPADLTIVTKIGALRDAEGNWPPARSPEQLTRAVHDNLKRLGLDVLEIVNLRLGGRDGPEDSSLEPQMSVMLELQRQGLVRHIGLSTVSPRQYREAAAMGPVVCIQNYYNIAHRGDDAFIDELGEAGVAYVPYFPLGGFAPLQSSALSEAARALDATPMQVALAWLLRRAPNILLIPGTSSLAHLRENLAAASLDLPPERAAALDRIGERGSQSANG
jgi:pyridoxine 4-dehydrogenase